MPARELVAVALGEYFEGLHLAGAVYLGEECLCGKVLPVVEETSRQLDGERQSTQGLEERVGVWTKRAVAGVEECKRVIWIQNAERKPWAD